MEPIIIRAAIRCCLAALLASGCFLVPSEEDVYRKKLQDSQGKARAFGHAWRLAKAQRADLDLFKLRDERNSLTDYLKKHGLDWESDGSEITYREVVEYVSGHISPGRLERLTPRDAWGFDYEFRVIEGFLAVRSPGADGIFNQSVYYGESFPWLSGGDIVVVGGRTLTQIEIPQASDWFRLTPPPGKESDGK